MTKTIWKYGLDIAGAQEIDMTPGAELLAVQTQRGFPVLWAMVDRDNLARQRRRIFTVGTGHDCDFAGKYVGTYQTAGGSLVWHVFDGGYVS